MLLGEIRDARDGAHRGRGRAHRPPRALDAAHQRRAVRRSSGSPRWASSRSSSARALECVLAQRLARRLCGRCKEAYSPTRPARARPAGARARRAAADAVPGGRAAPPAPRPATAAGSPLHEVMAVTEDIERLAVARESAAGDRPAGARAGDGHPARRRAEQGRCSGVTSSRRSCASSSDPSTAVGGRPSTRRERRASTPGADRAGRQPSDGPPARGRPCPEAVPGGPTTGPTLPGDWTAPLRRLPRHDGPQRCPRRPRAGAPRPRVGPSAAPSVAAAAERALRPGRARRRPGRVRRARPAAARGARAGAHRRRGQQRGEQRLPRRRLLATCSQRGGSDLHLTVGAPPMRAPARRPAASSRATRCSSADVLRKTLYAMLTRQAARALRGRPRARLRVQPARPGPLPRQRVPPARRGRRRLPRHPARDPAARGARRPAGRRRLRAACPAASSSSPARPAPASPRPSPRSSTWPTAPAPTTS